MDREKVIKGLECCSDAVLECGENCPYWNIENCQSSMQDDALALLKAQAPARHGFWEEHEDCNGDYYYTCSVCNCYWTLIDGMPYENNMFYCPECGAKMDGERRE